MQRTAAAGDFGNGVSGFGGGFPHNYRFLNADLSVYLFRPPAGEWIRLQARSWWDAGGVGLAKSELSDRDGLVGTGQQALALEGPST
jgi:acyl-CoA thioesterase